jgi:quercetin dioxygenase-like cupin family protein
VRVKMPPHYLIPPHSHPDGQAVWLVSGTVVFGFGEMDRMLSYLTTPGSFLPHP